MPRKAAALDLDFTLHDDHAKMSEIMDQHTTDETRTTSPEEVQDSTTPNVPEAQEETPPPATVEEAEAAAAQQTPDEKQKEEDTKVVEENMAASEATPELEDPAAKPEVEQEAPAGVDDTVPEEAESAAEEILGGDNADLEAQDLGSEAPQETTAPEEGAATTLEASEPQAAQEEERPAEDTDAHADAEEEALRPSSPVVNRKTSLRTEALIQAAARAVMAKIERRNSGTLDVPEEDEFDNSLLSTGSPMDDAESPRHAPSHSLSSDDAGNSSSPNDPDDDDLFSDRSARSSVCSIDAHPMPESDDAKTPQPKEKPSRRDSYATTTSTTTTTTGHHATHSPRIISGFSTSTAPTDDKSFTPTARLPFRTPSEIRAMHLSSPTPSRGSGSQSGGGSLSRIASPTPTTLSATQYSPKGRTPPRFKPPRPDPAPLVLLHVTLLPLRWAWGDVLALAPEGGECEADGALRGLKDAWRMLQDRVGDTVLERGVLLPHPQNDYEVLEERLLEALELPLRRRARILACGHYLGAANLGGEEEDEEEEGDKTEWCGTCKGEIRLEQLGPGRVFRVKVYASNGLMRAGAWEACWREMERVDVEVEPIVELAVQAELEKLGALQLEMEEERRREEEELERAIEMEAAAAVKAEMLRVETPALEQSRLDAIASSRPASAMHTRLEAMTSSRPASALQFAAASNSLIRARTPTPAPHQSEPIDTSEDRRRRDEERLREIYGDEPSQPQPQSHPDEPPYPPPSQTLTLAHPQQPQRLLTDGTDHPPYPSNPHPQTYPNDHHNSNAHTSPYNNTPPHPSQAPAPTSSLGPNPSATDLATEALRVLLRDPKNVAILHQPGGQGGALGVPVQREVKMLGAVEEVAVAVEAVVGIEKVPVVVEQAARAAPEVAAPEVEVVVESAAVEEVVEEVVEEQKVEVEAEVQEEEAVPATVEVVEEFKDEPVVEETAVTLAPVDLGDICLPHGLEYPVTLVGDVPIQEETEQALASPMEGTEEPLADNQEEPAPTTSATSASTTSLFIPGPYVTERKTVRVFETVTETVRVSVVTETETVSTVVTAVPQTVEETVYETETVRITVSVPVEEQMDRERKKKKGEGKECKGWF
ncbi:hypothetical protein C8A05DRAFT_42990 [Staphylotrichum tortipilum]|uniref:Pathway-specific nitrogen regulator n=1 Tax=Staphylotrichum tortipilum TaxID=2831512 RepID=A0AAN6MNE6_9PEZI|nr:hypothetical protein C8A05DRAFT_42990 [Staphylotrichum longicolle]